MTKEEIIDAFLKEGYTVNMKYIYENVIITATKDDEPFGEMITGRKLETEMLNLLYDTVVGPFDNIQDFDNDTYS